MFALTTTLTNLFIATALIPSAFGSTFRHLNAESYQAVMSGPPPYCFIENGFDYVGNDIANVPGQAADCCNKCSANGNCKVWSWSNYNGGTCWLKSGRGEIIVSPNVKSAVLFYGYRPTCQASDDIDYPGNDLARVDGASVADCCSKCQNYAGCRAYSWTNLNGGSCWLKSKVTQIINKPGVKSAQAYPDIYDSCVFVMYNTDFVGNDIGNKPSGSYAGCCDICKTTPNCKAYSWSNHNGGTCWLKSKKGQNIYNPGVISAQVYPDNSLCNIQTDTDYVDNDIGNVPGKDAGECCGKCHERSDCKAFAWSDQNGGTCWLKSAKGQVISKPGVSAGTI